MAEKTFGTAHLYGIVGSLTNATVLSFSKRDSHQLEDATVDEDGIEIERRYDDEYCEASITIRMQSAYSEPGIGSTLTYDSTTYEITSKDRNEESKGYRTLALSMKKSEGISYS